MPHTEPLPRLAAQLGYAGLIPFVAGAAITWLPGPMPFSIEHWPLLAYGAVILTFMGAIHWGLAMHTGQMNHEWVQKYGCPDLGVPPNAKSVERQYLQVAAICAAAGIPLPNDFKDSPHVAGDSCPFCAFIALDQGFAPIKWYLHPADSAAPPQAPPKPRGREHCYVHQVFKCAWGFAIRHVLVRRDRDAGRGEVNAALFVQRAAPASGV